jgi:hypothetical protein
MEPNEALCSSLPEVCSQRNYWFVFYATAATAALYCAARYLFRTARPSAGFEVVPGRVVPMAILAILLVAAHVVGYELASDQDSWREFFVAFTVAGRDPVASFVIIPHLWIALALLAGAIAAAALGAETTSRPIIKVLAAATLVLMVVGSFWTAFLMDGVG